MIMTELSAPGRRKCTNSISLVLVARVDRKMATKPRRLFDVRTPTLACCWCRAGMRHTVYVGHATYRK